jgi:hypothetical protein
MITGKDERLGHRRSRAHRRFVGRNRDKAVGVEREAYRLIAFEVNPIRRGVGVEAPVIGPGQVNVAFGIECDRISLRSTLGSQAPRKIPLTRRQLKSRFSQADPDRVQFGVPVLIPTADTVSARRVWSKR